MYRSSERKVISTEMVILLFLEGTTDVSATFVEIAAIMASVGTKTSLTNEKALEYLQQTTQLLQKDYNNGDPDLGCSVVESSHIMEAIVDRFLHGATVDETLIKVAKEMGTVAAEIFRGISRSFCVWECEGSCQLSLIYIYPLKITTENSLFKMIRVVLVKLNADNKNITDVELFSDISMFGYIQNVDDVFDEENKFNIIRIPKTPGNIAAKKSYQHETLFVVMLFCKNNLLSFLSDPFGINAGILITYIFDENGEKLDIFEPIEVLVDTTTDPYDTSNIRQPRYLKDSFNLGVSFDLGDEDGMVSVVVNNTHECTMSVISNKTSFDIVTRGTNIILSDGSPRQIEVLFSDQTVSLYATPPNPPMDLHVYCKACMQVADVIFVMDGSLSVGIANFEMMKRYIIDTIKTLQIGKKEVRVGFMTFSSVPQIIFHLGETYDTTVMTSKILAATYVMMFTYSGLAMKTVKDVMLLRSRPNVQKLVVLVADGLSNDRLELYAQTEALKASGVEIACVGIGILDKEEFETISSQPAEAYFLPVGNFSELNELNLIDEICAGMWTNLTSNQVRAGKLGLYRLNNNSQWEDPIDIRIKTMGNPVVFESNFFGTFGMSVMGIPPETIDFEEVLTDIDEKVAETPHVLAMNCGLLVVLVLGVVIMRRLDLEDNRMWQYKPLADNVDSAKYSYYISVHTGFWSCSRLSSIPYIILKGWYGETMCRPLVDKGGMFRNLIRWRCFNFLLKTDIKLGPLSDVKIWHDNTGENRNLFLDKILISTGKLEETFVFFCNDWLSDSKGDGNTYRRLFCANGEFKDGNNLFSSLARFRLFDEHLLLSLLGRPTFSRFSRVQRLLCVAAMLSMSFLASAMFFRADDDVHIHGITIGPVKVNYKQLYVGLVTSFLTFPIGLIVGFIFRNRRFKQSLKDMSKVENITKDRAKLPWYAIFIGYAISTSALASGTFFTTLYSLQWGPEVSTDWMMSILFGTTHGIVFFDPSKVIFFSLIFALVFKGFARKEIEIMAPFYEDKEFKGTKVLCDIPFYSKWPGDNKESAAQAEMRRRLGLDQKLSGYFRGILLEMLFVMLLGLICSHCVITNAYLQNDKLIQQLEPSYPINVTDDIWHWMTDKYLPNMLPRYRYNDELKTPEERKFMTDGISYRMGSVRLRQIRTSGMCKIPSVMKSTIIQCSPDLKTLTEERNDFCPGWKPYLPSCDGAGFTYMEAKETKTFSKLGEYDMYEGGGFVRDLNPFMTDIYYEIYKLRREHWADNRTRFVSVENVVLNVNTKLFSLITFVFEIPTVGGIYSSASVVTSRLYPYINSWDYLVLAGQLVFVLLTFVRNIFLIYDAWKLKAKCLKSLTFWSHVLSLVLSYAAIACYIARIDRTIVIVEKIFNSIGEFMSFELVQLLDDIYKGCLGVVLFIAILQLLKSLSFNYYIYMMKTSIKLAQSDMYSYAVMVAIMLAAFSSFMHVVYGPSSFHFRNFLSTFTTLFRMMLAMVTFRDAELNSNAESNIIFSVFVFIMTILMVNVFICILNDSFAVVKSSWNDNKDIEPFDEELNEHFWWKIRQVFKSCASYSDPGSIYQKENREDVHDDLKQLDEMVGRLFAQTSAFGNGFKH